MFLSHIAHDVYVCGKTINLLKLCCPQVRGGVAGLRQPHAACPSALSPGPYGSSPGWVTSSCPLESFMSGSVEFLVLLQRWEESRRPFRGQRGSGPLPLPHLGNCPRGMGRAVSAGGWTQGSCEGSQGSAVPWSRGLSWCPCSQGQWPVAVGGMGGPCGRRCLVSGQAGGCGRGLLAVQQPGAGQGRGQRPAECRAERSGLERPAWAQGCCGGYSVHEPPGAAQVLAVGGGAPVVGRADLREALWVCLGLPTFSWSLTCGSQAWPWAETHTCCSGAVGGVSGEHSTPEAGCPRGSRAGGKTGCGCQSLGSGAAPTPALQHYLCCSDVPVPRISVTFSLEELKDIEKDCATYVGRMERVARHSSVSKEEKVRAPQPGLPWPSLSSPPGAGWALGSPILARPWLQGSRA